MHPASCQDAITHGEYLFQTRHIQEALHVFESMIEKEPYKILALNNKGVVLHALREYAEAEQIFLNILRQVNSNDNAVFNLITLYIDQYNMRSAEDILLKYGACLNTQDIHELKEKLHIIQNALDPTHQT